MRRTKIVATVGPASDDEATLGALIDAGTDVLRINFSHGDQASHARTIARAQAAARDRERAVAMMQDLQGPKIRVGRLRGGHAELRAGARCLIAPSQGPGTAARFSTTYNRLARDVRAGDSILLDDGAMELRVVSVDGDGVACEVVRGGNLHDHKGINLPGVHIVAPALTAKDRGDLRFGLACGVDVVALSFVRTAADVRKVRGVMARAGRRIPVIAKIETPQALDALDAVLRAFDGAMVARGDLGVEVGPELVPAAQKRIIARANALGRPVITATQMLESMTTEDRPTRAEASDVANAVLDGTDAVMLSGETAIGAHPVEVVRAMDRIVRAAEAIPAAVAAGERGAPSRDRSAAVCAAAAGLAQEIGADAIAAYTRSGRTARTLSQQRGRVPVLAFCEREEAARELSLWHGVHAINARANDGRDAVARIAAELGDRALLARGAVVVVVGASPGTRPGQTDFVRVIRL
jgi:pyruvate kinase